MNGSAKLDGNVVVLGYGTIGQCALPLLLDRLQLPASRFVVVDRRTGGHSLLPQYAEAGLRVLEREITPDNLHQILHEAAGGGDLLVNLSVGIDSLEVADWCHCNGVAYVDTALEPWEGFLGDTAVPAAERTEYALHQRARNHAARRWRSDGPTAVFTHGANPGLVSHFAKAGLVEVARALDAQFDVPSSRSDWGRLARALAVKVIHISERDTQVAAKPRRPGEFVNTWSIAGFVDEAMMPVEFGWGTHENEMPAEAREHASGPRNTIYFDQAAARFLLYSWVPSHGQILGLSLPHSESITLSDYLTLTENEAPVYRPTVAFVYLPCDGALASLHETMMQGWEEPDSERVIKKEVVAGQDELGVLLLGHGLNGWWYGSQLDIEVARRIVPHSNPTALQVAAGVVAASLWIIENPACGYCEPEDLPHDFILDAARPYLGRMVSQQTDWTPLEQRKFLFRSEPRDSGDPWQFANFRQT